MVLYATYSRYIDATQKWVDIYFETDTNQVLTVAKGQAGYPTSRQFVSGDILDKLNDPNKSNSYLALVNGNLTYNDATYKDLKIQTQQGNLFLTGQVTQIQAVAGDIMLLPKTGSKVYAQHGLYTEGYVQSGEVITERITGKSGETPSPIEIYYGVIKTGEFNSNGLELSQGRKITLNYVPSHYSDAVNKQYVDMVAGYGVNPIEAVKVATTKNITLSGTTGEGSNKIDGVTIQVGDRVLVKNQTNAKDNGVYIVASGAWERAEDAETPAQLTGGLVGVNEGTENKRCLFYQRSIVSTVGTSNQEWILFMNAADYYTAYEGLYLSGNAFGINSGGVTETKIATNAVTTAKIKDKNVTTAKIADKGVTTSKIANNAVIADHLANGIISNAHIKNDAAISLNKLESTSITQASNLNNYATPQKIDANIGMLAKQMANILGKTNWYDNVPKSLDELNTEVGKKQNKIHYGETAPTSPQVGDIWIRISS